MKNFTPKFLIIASLFSLGCVAQQSARKGNRPNAQHFELLASNDTENGLAIVTYQVEERVNMKFGASITKYEVSDISLVSTNDLGPNNTRVVTPKYSMAKPKVAKVSGAVQTPAAAPLSSTINPMAAEVIKPKKEIKTVYIDLISTYERVLEKGYKNIDLLKKVSNQRFFEGDLEAAAKWYTVLFSMTTDFEPVYYYRYGQALKAVNQIEKSNEMMAIFKTKDL